MSSLAVGRGLEDDLGLWLAGLFTAVELAAAELLLQLSGAGEDGDKAASTSTAFSSPPPWVSPCHEDLTVDEEERVVKEQAVSTELDRRARKRYRRLAELYAVTSQVTTASDAPAMKKKRKRHHHQSTATGSGGGGDEVRRRHDRWKLRLYRNKQVLVRQRLHF